MDVEFADPTYTVKELKAKIARIGLKLPAKGSGKDGRLVKKDYEKILKMYKNKAVLELIKESTTYTVKELKATVGFRCARRRGSLGYGGVLGAGTRARLHGAAARRDPEYLD